MTIADESTRVTHNCNGSTTAFAFSFRIFNQEDIQVYLTHNTTGAETLLTLTTDYTVSGDYRFGGTVTTVQTYPNTHTLTIILKLALKQETDLIYAGTYSSETIERMSDRLTKLVQQLTERINRALLFKTTSGESGLLIPDLAANEFFAVNAAGDAIELVALATVGQISDAVYSAAVWDNDKNAASKNALRDKIVLIDAAVNTNIANITTNVSTINTKQRKVDDITSLELGASLSGNRSAYLDLHADDTYGDYSARILRSAGENGAMQIEQRGTGTIVLKTQEAAYINFYTSNLLRLILNHEGSLTLGAVEALGGGIGVFCMGNCNTIPTSNPTNAAILYVSGGNFRVRNTGGEIDTLNDKFNNSCATDKVLGRATAGTGVVEQIACTPFARTILDDVNAVAVRTTIGAAAGGALIAQEDLKTSQGEVSAYNTDCEVVALPGGEYGFYPQTRASTASGTHSYGWMFGENGYDAGWKGLDQSSVHTTYNIHVTMRATNAATAYARVRYITASGEVHWIFLKRNKETGIIEAAYQAPDHPCFGNGGKPLLVPHPFSNFNSDTHEIIVMNPTLDDIQRMTLEAINLAEDEPDRSLLEVILDDYETGTQESWPDVPVTTGLPLTMEINDKETLVDYRFLPPGTKIHPVKKRIVKPAKFLCRSIKKKMSTKMGFRK